MPGGEAACADHVDLALDCELGRLARGLEQRAGNDFEAQVTEGRTDQIGPAVVPVLAHLGDQHPGLSTEPPGDRDGALLGLLPSEIGALAIDAADRSGGGRIAPEGAFERIGNLAQRCAGAGGGDGEGKEVRSSLGLLGEGDRRRSRGWRGNPGRTSAFPFVVAARCHLPEQSSRRIFGAILQRVQRGPNRTLVALAAQPCEPIDLTCADLGVVDLEDVEFGFVLQPIAVDPDDHRRSGVDPGLTFGGGLLDAPLGKAVGDRLGHSARSLDLVDQRLGLFLELAGQGLDIPASAERIGDRGDPAFLGEDELSVAGDPSREIGRERDCLVEAVGMERLGSAEHRSKRLDRGSDDIIVRVLLGQRHARSLAVGAKQLRLFGGCAEIGHDPGPQRTRCAQLGDLHEQVHADAEEEAQARGEGVDREALRGGGADIFHPVGKGEGKFLNRGRTRLVHMIARDRDGVEPGHLARGVGDDVADDPHRRLRRVDVGVADRELFQNVVLDRSRKRGRRHSLLLARDDVEGHDRKNRPVHGHADAHFAQRNPVEQQLHVLDAVDRDPGLADVAGHSRMVAVVAAVGG